MLLMMFCALTRPRRIAPPRMVVIAVVILNEFMNLLIFVFLL
ncbi:hypothetical protein LBBP_03118 [Leptospira borgpetersenii serovar Ballum]|uniref:Uncharacterized protein n=1 Tax=Leptospira borgpetersenii serovar Ballum TaxID=280505 RepID=A0A0S2IUK3_LEPBO|nr:hypothetical protein LBBP_03118 [Leptospira borgpetersenii serovar Ballum]